MSAADISFQMYSARMLPTLDERLKLLAGLGYRRIETYREPFDDLAGLKAAMARHGVSISSCHVGFDRWRADPDAGLRVAEALGCRLVILPAPLPDEREGDAAHWRRLGAEANSYQKLAARAGLTLAYHNHHWEYGLAPDGRRFLDLIFEEAPDLKWEADFAWIARGGADPVAEARRLRSRMVACHIKDNAPDGQCADEGGFADPGHGVLPWPVLVREIRAGGWPLLVAEHDNPNDVARFARRARETIASWM